MSLVSCILFFSKNKKQREVCKNLILKAEESALNEYDKEHKTLPILIAGEMGNTEACEALLNRGVDINSSYPSTMLTALIEASTFGHLKTVKFLIERKADIQSIDDRGGMTALHWAAGKGHDKIVLLLLANGADKCKKNFNESLPIDVAIAMKQDRIVEILK
jgi:ankyrin repeat protein